MAIVWLRSHTFFVNTKSLQVIAIFQNKSNIRRRGLRERNGFWTKFVLQMGRFRKLANAGFLFLTFVSAKYKE